MNLFDSLFPTDPEDWRAWLIDRCTEIKRRHMEAAEAEMKPYINMLAMLPAPRVIISAELLTAFSSLHKDK